MAENVTFPATLTNPAWLEKGDNAWQLTAASFVALQSVRGLVVLYVDIAPGPSRAAQETAD